MSLLPPLIGLIGKKRTGKDSFAEAIAESHGYVRVSFAGPLKAAALALDPIVGEMPLPGSLSPCGPVRLSDAVEALGWEKAKDYIPEVRRVLQRLGTDAIRALDDDFWLRIGRQRIADLRAGGSPVVVTDVRFPNEADAIRDAGGVLIRLVRPSAGQGDAHPSETALDDYVENYRLSNTGTLKVLRDTARSLAGDLERLEA